MWFNDAGDAIRSGTAELNSINQNRLHESEIAFPVISPPLTIVVRFRVSPTNNGTVSLFGSNGLSYIQSRITGTSSFSCLINNVAVTGFLWDVTPGAWHVGMVVWNGSSTGYIYMDDGVTAKRSGAGASGSVSSHAHTLGGGNGDSDNQVEMSDCLVYNTSFSSTDRQSIMAYLHRNTSYMVDQTSSNHELNCGNVLSKVKSDAFTLSVMVSTTSTSSTHVLIGKYDTTTSDGYYLYWSYSTQRINMYMRSSGGQFVLLAYSSFASLDDGNWHQVVMAYDGSATAAGISFYVDGEQQTTNILTDTNTGEDMGSSGDFRVGGFQISGSALVGQWRHAIVWNKELSSTEVENLYALLGGGGLNPDYTTIAPANVEAYWPVTYTDWDDYPTVYDVARRYLALTFNGSNEYITMGDVLAYERTDAFSISCWVKTTASAIGHLVGRHSSTTAATGYALLVDASGKPYIDIISSFTGNNYIQVGTSAASVNDGVWHNIIVTYDGSSVAANVKFYVDGSLVTSTTYKDTLSASIVASSPFTIGRRATSASSLYSYLGELDQVAMYGKELSGSEVSTIYTAGRVGDLTGVGPTSDLDGYWPVNTSDTATTVFDASSGGNDGTLVNMDATNYEALDGTLTVLSADYVKPAEDWPTY
jgi:hypothetical protein